MLRSPNQRANQMRRSYKNEEFDWLYVIATLSVYPHRASLKNMPGHGGIRTYDLWNACPRPDRVAQLAEHWASIPKVVGSKPTVARHIFQACPVWIYTQSSNYIHLIHLST